MTSHTRWTSLLILLAALALASCAGTATTHAPKPTATTAPTFPAGPFRPDFERGMAFPRWGPGVYGAADTTWAPDVQDMRAQTGAQWIELTVNLYQQSDSSTSVFPTANNTPSPDDLAQGISSARAAGFHVFLEPILSVLGGPADTWGGRVTFGSEAQAQMWFQSYWAAYKPYVVAAVSAGVNQVSIGTEYDKLENSFPDQWRWLLAQMRGVFAGPISYAINHSSIAKPLPSWMTDPNLTYVGVSMYMSLAPRVEALTEAQIEAQWKQQVLPLLDSLSRQAGKPALISEVGYRDAADALYVPWGSQTTAPADPQLQTAAYAAAARSAMSDPHVAGVFFWAWDDGVFSPDHRPAAQALHTLYTAEQPLTVKLP